MKNTIYKILHAMHDKYRQLFVNIDIEEAQSQGFRFHRNIYGDEINQINCRSIWIDEKNRYWCVNQLKK